MSVTPEANLENQLASVCPEVFSPDEYGYRRNMWRRDIQQEMAAANARENEAWEGVSTVATWEAFRDRRIDALKRSLVLPSEPAPAPEARVTGTIAAEGYRIEKLVYETRPGVLATALLYLPDPARENMPAIQICHAHHRPKEQAELQDMGAIWARAGTVVLVPDLLGHGERGDDPFGGREGYYSRYYEAMQLHLVGESLTGWMVWDLMCGNGILQGTPGVDASRLIVIGAVAGGGDLAAITAALDGRVGCLVCFNFGAGAAWRTDLGGDVPDGINFAGNGYWETTRNLWLGLRDGFLPWVIVAAAAPRHLIHAHEFAWDSDNDPAWHRVRKVYDLYEAADRLGWMKGEGRCAPGAGNTHCTNVGPIHREGIYPWLRTWFGMEPPLPEFEDRRTADDLRCMDDEAAQRRTPLREITSQQAERMISSLRVRLANVSPGERQAELRRGWDSVLGSTEPLQQVEAEARHRTALNGIVSQSMLLRVEAGISLPALLLLPDTAGGRPPAVIALAHHGKRIFLDRRSSEIAQLLRSNVAVFLVDPRGTGETRPDEMHGLQSECIKGSEDERMLGRSVIGLQLRDLRAVVAHLADRGEIDGSRLAVWAESFAPRNPDDIEFAPHDARKVDQTLRPNLPHGPVLAEPSAPLIALLGALFEDPVQCVLIRHPLAAFASAFCSYRLCIPSDVIVPGMFRGGDVSDLAAALAPRPLRIESPVDACNRLAAEKALDEWFEPAKQAYASTPERLSLSRDVGEDGGQWLAEALRPGPDA